MQTFAEFWIHEAPGLPCCQFVSDEEIRADPEAYDCAVCPVADALGEIQRDTSAWHAWSLYRQIVGRFTYEGHLIGPVFERLTQDLDQDDYMDLLARFSMLFDICNPPPERKE